MIKFVSIASEHELVPNQFLDKSEMTERNRVSYNESWLSHDLDRASYKVYCTYAWIETDEIEVHNNFGNQIPVAVMDYRPKYSRRTQFVFEEPVWHWIEDLRTPDEQRWISRNIERINELFKEFANIETK